jgi:hypothetical protein
VLLGAVDLERPSHAGDVDRSVTLLVASVAELRKNSVIKEVYII